MTPINEDLLLVQNFQPEEKQIKKVEITTKMAKQYLKNSILNNL